jgi:predicted ferric reductase
VTGSRYGERGPRPAPYRRPAPTGAPYREPHRPQPPPRPRRAGPAPGPSPELRRAAPRAVRPAPGYPPTREQRHPPAAAPFRRPVFTDQHEDAAPARSSRLGPVTGLLLVPLGVLALCTWSWWTAAHLTGPGAVLTAAGQLTGLATSVFALGTVSLMARVPVVTHSLGVDRAIRWHRLAATATMVFLPVHVVTTTLGYAAGTQTSFAAQFATFVTSTPDMATATVAAALFVMVSTTSIRAIRRRFRYQTWLFVHWYSYLAVALAFGHELALGASFVNAEWPTLLWTWLHLFVAGMIVWFRLLKPLTLMVTHPLHVAAVVPEAPNAVSIVLRGDDLDDYGAEAGHHLRVRFITRAGWWQSHPISLSAAPRRDGWRITVAAAGDHTTWMQQVRVGTPVLVSGAYGHLTAERCRQRRVALIGAGSGITPLRALLESLPTGVEARVLYRARSRDDLLHPYELDRLAAARRGRVDYLLGPRHPDPERDVLSPGSIGRLVPDLPTRDVYVCGLAGFVDRVADTLRTLGVPRTQIHLERYDP